MSGEPMAPERLLRVLLDATMAQGTPEEIYRLRVRIIRERDAATRRDATDEAIKAMCRLCREGVPLGPPKLSMGWDWYHTREAGTDAWCGDCAAAPIRAAQQPCPARRGE